MLETQPISRTAYPAGRRSRIPLPHGELKVREIETGWDEETLLHQTGIFGLKEVVAKLHLVSAKLKKMAYDSESAWTDMGIDLHEGAWLVHMPTFAAWYRHHRNTLIRVVHQDWDANTLLCQEGRFFLLEVCTKIPFTTQQLRYQARKLMDPRTEMGIWKDPDRKHYLVQMEVFGPWLRKVWHKSKGS